MKRVLIVYLILFFSIAGCTSLLNESDLCGTYIAEYLFGKDVLTLDSNMTYLQEIILSDTNDTLRLSGNWKYDYDYGGCVVLENCLIVVDVRCDEKDLEIDTLQNGHNSLGITWLGPWSRVRLSTQCEGKYLIKSK